MNNTMNHDLRSTSLRLLIGLVTTFAITPVIGYGIAIAMGLISPAQLLSWPHNLLLFGMYALLLGSMARHFYHIFQPLLKPRTARQKDHVLDKLGARLYGFSDRYWSFFLLYVLLFPTIQHWFGLAIHNDSTYLGLLNFILVQLVVAILVGMPTYLMALSSLGRIAHYSGLDQVYISMRSKILLIGVFIPMLSGTILLNFFWWRSGDLTTEIVLAWGLMSLVALVITFIAIRSLSQSLSPVQDVIASTAASNYQELADRMQPRSIDEIGYLIQTLGRMFRRLGDQESHMQAIVNNAAEGIIVVNDRDKIETFNPAAEHLFGYSALDIRGKPLAKLLPELTPELLHSHAYTDELEINGLHRSGISIPVSLRASNMNMEGRAYCTLMVADISDRKATEKMLLEAEARYRDLVETAHDLVWSMDTQGHWTYLNDAVSRIYGYTAAEMLHRHFTEFQAPESTEKDAAAHATLLRGHDIVEYETVHFDKNGYRRHISFNARPQYNTAGKIVQITGTARDITEQKAYEHELAYQAQHDTLTGLYNRNYFQQELEREVARIERSGTESAMLYLDLDQFKYVNDTLGHASGDRLLVQSAQMLRSHLRDGDLLARFGGDEFTIFLSDTDMDGALHVAESIRTLFENFRFIESGQAINVTVSIGICSINGNTLNADEALSQADLACNIAKSQGRNCLHRHNPADRNKDGMAEDMGWASRVRDSFENDKFKLAFQPIVSIASGEIHDYEVLLRMRLDDGDSILPGGFMPAADRFGLINQVDRWVVDKAVTKLAELHQDNTSVRFAINLSARAFEDKDLLPMIHSILGDTGLNPAALTFEITETATISNLSEATRFIYKLKDMGCMFALDDFGTGFSSFAYLKHLPVDKLKIDGSFVKNMASSSVDQAMVQSMNQIAHALGKLTIAEFVENNATLRMLKEYGVDYAQGNYLSKPQTDIHIARPGQESTISLN